ncbi:MAG: DUF72 domain-containing protein [Deltaproteobacteria bacterium]|nr:DUF72 domain-containing protein [Deltaproteobacteria bacterium]
MIEVGRKVGTVGFPMARSRVLAAVDVVELTEAEDSLPKAAIGYKWRAEAPSTVGFTMLAPRALVETPGPRTAVTGDRSAYGDLKPSSENVALFARAAAFARAVEARAMVLVTPPSVSPAPSSVAQMSAFFAAVDRGDMDLVWEPHGAWEHERAAAFAREHGIVLAVDPLRDPPPAGDAAYFRLPPFAAMGSRMGVYDLERLAEAAMAFERLVCVFATARALDDARNLKSLLAGGAVEPSDEESEDGGDDGDEEDEEE